jgi:hypothetical protein
LGFRLGGGFFGWSFCILFHNTMSIAQTFWKVKITVTAHRPGKFPGGISYPYHRFATPLLPARCWFVCIGGIGVSRKVKNIAWFWGFSRSNIVQVFVILKNSGHFGLDPESISGRPGLDPGPRLIWRRFFKSDLFVLPGFRVKPGMTLQVPDWVWNDQEF